MYVPLAELPHQLDTNCMKGVGTCPDLKGSSYTTTEDRKAYRGKKGTNTVKEKTNAQLAKRLNEFS